MLEYLLSTSREVIIPQGQIILETSQTWVVPPGVHFISVVAVGQGGEGTFIQRHLYRGGGGGSLSYRNHIPVTPGETLNVLLHADYIALRRNSTLLVRANHAKGPIGGAAYNLAGQVSFRGGTAGTLGPYVLSNNPRRYTGGAGAAGYAANGPDSPSITTIPTGNDILYIPGVAGQGGAGGSAITAVSRDNLGLVTISYGGGGVGLLGQSTDGRGGLINNYRNYSGGGGSRGDVGWRFYNPGYSGTGDYGGGGSMNSDGLSVFGKAGLRIIWGKDRYFPNTNTTDQPIILMP